MLRVLKFKTEYRPNGDPRDWVELAPMGDGFEKTRSWHRIADITPPKNAPDDVKDTLSYKDMEAKWSVIGPAYEAYKEGNEIPETGTPLAAWSGVSPEQAAMLKQHGIRTVEEVTAMGDTTISRLNMPNARQLPKLAKDFLEGADAAAKAEEINDLKAQVAAMKEMLEEARHSEPEEKPKRPRGRPRKEQAA